MSDILFLCRVALRRCCLFAIASALLTVSATAQDTPTEREKERDSQVRIGIYLSGKGFVNDFDIGVKESGDIESPSHDIMPYPFRFFSIRYNRYQDVFGWGDDRFLSGGRKHNNEHITKFAARYNYYPFKKIGTYMEDLFFGVFKKNFPLKKMFLQQVCYRKDATKKQYLLTLRRIALTVNQRRLESMPDLA